MGIWQRSWSRSISRRFERLRRSDWVRGKYREKSSEGRQQSIRRWGRGYRVAISYTQIQNKVLKEKNNIKLKKQCFTSFIGGNAVHEFASGSYFSPELRVCLFSSWPPNTNKNPSAKIKGDTWESWNLSLEHLSPVEYKCHSYRDNMWRKFWQQWIWDLYHISFDPWWQSQVCESLLPFYFAQYVWVDSLYSIA